MCLPVDGWKVEITTDNFVGEVKREFCIISHYSVWAVIAIRAIGVRVGFWLFIGATRTVL